MKKVLVYLVLIVFCCCGCVYAKTSGRRDFKTIEQTDASSDVPNFMTIINIEKAHESTEVIMDANSYEEIINLSIERGIYQPGYSYETKDNIMVRTITKPVNPEK